MSEPVDATLVEAAQLVSFPDMQFADIFDELARQHGCLDYKSVRMSCGYEQGAALRLRAFREARAHNFLPLLMERLIAAGAVAQMNEIKGNTVQAHVVLQQMVRPDEGFDDAYVSSRGAVLACQRVCRITVRLPDESLVYGSGFLVGPQVILTAGHVVRGLLTQEGRAGVGSHTRIFVEFDHFGVRSSRKLRVVQNWLVDYSACHALEADFSQTIDIDTVSDVGFDTFLDYAVLRLEEPVGVERGYYKLDRLHVPKLKGRHRNVALFQHPVGEPMKIARGPTERLWPEKFKSRLRHGVNSAIGSSGGLMLDIDFRPIAVHQCSYASSNGAALANGAIPTASIASRNLPLETVEGFLSLTRTDAGLPIIGRQQFQRYIFDAITGDTRIIVVKGRAKQGKTFSTTILRQMLGSAAHYVAEMRAEEIPPTAEALAELMLRKMCVDVGSDYVLPTIGESATARDGWIQDILFPAFLATITSAKLVRRVWLVIDDFDKLKDSTTASYEFLSTFFAQIAALPAIRVVLIGVSEVLSSIPGALAAIDQIEEVGVEDLRTYLGRRVLEVSQGEATMDVEMLANVLYRQMRSDTENGAACISRLLQDFVEPVIRDLNNA